MSARLLSVLQQVNPREVWTHEERDFTPWLLENGDRLAEALGIGSLRHAAAGRPAGPARGDEAPLGIQRAVPVRGRRRSRPPRRRRLRLLRHRGPARRPRRRRPRGTCCERSRARPISGPGRRRGRTRRRACAIPPSRATSARADAMRSRPASRSGSPGVLDLPSRRDGRLRRAAGPPPPPEPERPRARRGVSNDSRRPRRTRHTTLLSGRPRAARGPCRASSRGPWRARPRPSRAPR